MNYNPPFTLTNKILSLVASISEKLGRLSATQNTPQVTPHVPPQVDALLNEMREAGRCEENVDNIQKFKRETLQTLLGLKDKKSFVQRYLKPALKIGAIAMTIPEKPTSRLQEYKLTAMGKSYG